MRHFPLFFCLLASTFLPQLSRAQAPHETFYFQGTPTADQVASWSALPGTRSYLFDAGDPSGSELQNLSSLRGADRIDVEVQSYPAQDSIEAWKRLASQGIGLVVLNKPGLPTDDEVARLNSADFSKCLFVIDYFPDEADAQRLGGLRCQVSLTFATAAYPKFVDKPGLIAIPSDIPLLFASDYWPWYVHMDVFNMLPHRKRLRVSGSLPPEEELQYLHNIQNLDSLQINLEGDPEASSWKAFDGLRLTWSSQNHVPSEESLQAFAGNGGDRRLIVDSDTLLTAEESARLRRSPVPVEWIHQAPWQASSSASLLFRRGLGR